MVGLCMRVRLRVSVSVCVCEVFLTQVKLGHLKVMWISTQNFVYEKLIKISISVTWQTQYTQVPPKQHKAQAQQTAESTHTHAVLT